MPKIKDWLFNAVLWVFIGVPVCMYIGVGAIIRTIKQARVFVTTPAYARMTTKEELNEWLDGVFKANVDDLQHKIESWISSWK